MREDRRLRRRNETVQEILDTAIEVMTEDGVAGLSMAEVARRVGVRPPSLYQYFPSKMAIYDALFERGGRESADVLEPYSARLAEDPRAVIVAGQQAGVAWAMANPVLAQLLYWRPVPNFEPTPRPTSRRCACWKSCDQLSRRPCTPGSWHPKPPTTKVWRSTRRWSPA
ncbi:TetR/AcrR family transcriptional regulator [Streptomyces sp. NPDC058891]|uniref:TetR/AcrR family transcriptional regulator n=1 Tax=Streptomyces sp. NPDC058891 TaxID=3346667 RepID=UPI0036A39161